MDVKEDSICRLCLTVAENDYKIIDENTRKIFDVILLRLNLDISKDPIICKDCAEIADKCSYFKSVCINTEKRLLSFISDKSEAMVELKDVFKNEKDIEAVDGNFVCRFCSNHLSASNFVLLETLVNDVTFAKMLKLLMPQMDLNIIKDPVICTTCNHNFECYIKFIENCLKVEEKITKYSQNEASLCSAQVKLSEILHFKNIRESIFTPIHMMKLEKMEFEDINEENYVVYGSGTIKMEEELIIKDEALNSSGTDCKPSSNLYEFNIPIQNRFLEAERTCHTTQNCFNKRHSQSQIQYKCEESRKTPSTVNIFKCTMCTYQTNATVNLKRHMLIHKDITEVEMYKCSICTFKTRHKLNLKRHTLIHKDITEVETYKCLTCTFETRHKIGIKKHMLIHKDITEVETHKCSMCTYETKLKDSLKTHMLSHKKNTEVEMYKCSVCTVKTRRKLDLKRHMLLHKDITEVKMYKCPMCTFETRYKKCVKPHMLIHKDVTEVEMYKCAICNFVTRHKGALRQHVLIHRDSSEVEMFKCTMCTFETRKKGALKRHMLIHKNRGENV